MITDKPTTIINRLSFVLVGLVAAGAFVLSYASLRQTALAYGVPSELTWIWPLLVDFALVVFSLAVVRANLYQEKTLWPWLLVSIYTASTVGFNVLHAPTNLTARIVAVVAPVSLFLSFETLMAMLKSEVKRGSLVQSIAQITAKLSELEGLYQGQKDKLESELDSLGRERSAEIEAQAANRQNELANLEIQIGQLQEAVEVKAKTLASYTQDIEARREELKGLEIGQPKIFAPANLSLGQRRELVNRMAAEGMTNEAIAATLGCSVGTVKNDKQANKQIIDIVDIPGEAGHRNGHKRG